MGIYRSIVNAFRARHCFPGVAQAIKDGQRFIEAMAEGACAPAVPLISPYRGEKVVAGEGQWSTVYALASPVVIEGIPHARLVERATGYPRRGFTMEEDRAVLVAPLWASRDQALVKAGLVPAQAYAFLPAKDRYFMRLCTYMERFDATLQDSQLKTEGERITHAPETMRRFAATVRMVGRINEAGYLVGDVAPANFLFKEREGELVAGLSDTDGLFRIRSGIPRRLHDDAGKVNPPVAMMATMDYAAKDQLLGNGVALWTDMESLGIIGAHLAGFRHSGTASSAYMFNLDPSQMLDERARHIEGPSLERNAQAMGYEGLADIVKKMAAGDYDSVSHAAADLDALVAAGRQ